MSWAIIILFGSFLILLFLGIPISFTLAISSIFTMLYLNVPLMVIGQKMSDVLDNFSLMAIPFFILAGQIMSDSGIARRLVDFSNLLVGKIRGGLAFVNIIPPSHNAIIYAYAAGGLSIGRIFLAGAIPGVMIGLFLMIPAYIIAVKKNYPVEKKVELKDALKTSREAFFGLFTIVIILGGILSGIFTATEASAVAVVYAFCISFFIYKEVSLPKYWEILWGAGKTIIAVMFLIASASTFAWLMAYLRIPNMIAQAVLGISTNKYIILLLINIVLLLLGMIMDMAPLILITTPIFLPIVT